MIPVYLNAQLPRKEIHGKIVDNAVETEGIYILNKTSNAATITNRQGEFNIPVKLNDTLVFSALQFEVKFVHINNTIIDNGYLEIALTEKVNVLEPVFVTPYNLSGDLSKDIQYNRVKTPINAVSLGLPNATVKRPEYSQRMLMSASGGPLSLLINTLNGKIKKIKKLIRLQKEEKKIQATKDRFEIELFVEGLKIPEDYIDRFMYFCAADPSFKDFQDQNTLSILEYLNAKSIDFRKLNGLK
ncbi:hypothetical protein [Galbibacter sp. PAP.153]|uniref:hypothetical protein n=1 Tax=Galbibacter sp. PAP.153 TaxID=3104623 RepID=UPI00300B1DFE